MCSTGYLLYFRGFYLLSSDTGSAEQVVVLELYEAVSAKPPTWNMSKDHCSSLTLWRLTNLQALCKFKADKCQGVEFTLGVLKDISPWRQCQEKSFGFLYCLEKSWRRQKNILIGPNVTKKQKINSLIFMYFFYLNERKNILHSAMLRDPYDSGWSWVCQSQRWGFYSVLSESTLGISLP